MIMTKPLHIKKLRIFFLVLVISLAGIVCMLSGLDAPEYIRCKDIGVCEFLDVCGDLNAVQKTRILMSDMGRFFNHSLLLKICFGRSSTFVPLLKKIACSAGHIKDFASLNTLQILDRCVQPSHEILYPPLLKNGEVLADDKGQVSLSSGSISSSEAFQIITTVIIRC